jgi:hypothetical protein
LWQTRLNSLLKPNDVLVMEKVLRHAYIWIGTAAYTFIILVFTAFINCLVQLYLSRWVLLAYHAQIHFFQIFTWHKLANYLHSFPLCCFQPFSLLIYKFQYLLVLFLDWSYLWQYFRFWYLGWVVRWTIYLTLIFWFQRIIIY